MSRYVTTHGTLAAIMCSLRPIHIQVSLLPLLDRFGFHYKIFAVSATQSLEDFCFFFLHKSTPYGPLIHNLK